MGRKLALHPLCAVCRRDGGWVYDEDGNSTRCPNCWPTITPEQARDAGMQNTADAHPGESEAARRIIRDAAWIRERFSANDLHDLFQLAGITSQGVPGKAFVDVAGEGGWIVATDERVKSRKRGTNAHKITVWRSLKFGQQRDELFTDSPAESFVGHQKESA